MMDIGAEQVHNALFEATLSNWDRSEEGDTPRVPNHIVGQHVWAAHPHAMLGKRKRPPHKPWSWRPKLWVTLTGR